MDLDQVALERVIGILDSNLPERQKLEQTLRALAKWRSQLIGSTQVAHAGTRSRVDPLRG
jgi:hypothetical protein